MQRYFSYWRRGWWAWTLAVCLNLSALTITWASESIAREHPTALVLALLLFWTLVGAPLWGWLFECFAANSPRIAARAADHGAHERVGGPN